MQNSHSTPAPHTANTPDALADTAFNTADSAIDRDFDTAGASTSGVTAALFRVPDFYTDKAPAATNDPTPVADDRASTEPIPDSFDGSRIESSTDHQIEHTFDADATEETQCAKQAETTRSLARRPTGPVSPAARRRGPGSLGVVMPGMLPSRPTFTGRSTYDLGALTHGLIGAHAKSAAPHCDGKVETLLASMEAIASAVIDANPNATKVLVAEASCLALRYLTDWRPAWPWTLIGVNHQTGAGRVDLAWLRHSDGAVLFDEIKTTRFAGSPPPAAAWMAQAHRYATAGLKHLGPRFVGCRLIDLSGKRGWLLRHGQPRLSLIAGSTGPEFSVSVAASASETQREATSGTGVTPANSSPQFVPWDPATSDPKAASPDGTPGANEGEPVQFTIRPVRRGTVDEGEGA